MSHIRSFLFKGIFYFWSFLCCLVALPLLYLPYCQPKWLIGIQTVWSRSILILLRVIMGLKIDIQGRENIPLGGALIAAKHQSSFDTFVMHSIIHAPAFIMKKELLKIPLYGRFCEKTGMIPIDRDGGSKSMRALLKRTKEEIGEQRPVIIFPEGSRSVPGSHLPYQPGIYGIYKFLKMPVVPLALNSGVYWPKNGSLQAGGTIVLKFLSPILPGKEKEEFLTELENSIEHASIQLLQAN